LIRHLLILVIACIPVISHADPTRALQGIIRETNIPAAAWVILLPGKHPLIGTTGEHITADTPFRVGSITKTFTALTLLKAAEVKGMPLTTPVSGVLQAGEFSSPFLEAISLLDLVALTSGHTDLGFDSFNDNTARPLNEALRRNTDALTSLWPPGLLHSYSNATPGLSERAIEVITGQSYAQALQELVSAPLGLGSATLAQTPALPGGFHADGKSPIPYWNMTFKAFGGLNLSPRDMANFLEVLLQGGVRNGQPVWSAAIQQRLLNPASTLANMAGVRLGYGAGMYSRFRHGMLWHGHGGDADGYRSRYAFLPDKGAAYFVIINTDNPDALLRMENTLESHIAETIGVPPVGPLLIGPDLPAVGGTYYPATVRFGVDDWKNCRSTPAQLRVDRSTLYVRIGERRHRLRSIGNDLLAHRNSNEPVMALVGDTAGVRWFVGELGNYVLVKARDSAPVTSVPAFLPRCLAQ
jgi:CubicO group peptidase (beta-lactamase class C family)